MKKGAIIQARMGSSRLPGKVLMDLDGKPALQRMIERVRQANIDEVIIATTKNKVDDPIVYLCVEMGCKFYRGSEDDVLLRVLEAAKAHSIDLIVELTADCPLIDYTIIDMLIKMYCLSDESIRDRLIVGNIVVERTFPRGQDIRIFSTKTLSYANLECSNSVDRQHCSTFMYLNPKSKDNYKQLNCRAPHKLERPELDITLDTIEDYELINWLFKAGREYRLELTCGEVINLIDTYPERYKKVADIKRKDYFEELENCYASMKKGAKNQ